MITLHCKIIVKDKGGKVISEREIECDSFLSNFLALLRSALTNSFQTAVSVDGVVRTQAHIGYYAICYNAGAYGDRVNIPGLPNLRVDAPEASAGYGIVVGTRTTSVSPTDYKLENQIPHGTGLYHRAVSIGSVVVSGNVSKISMTRTLINYTSSDIVVRELGIYGLAFNLTTAVTYAVVRDVLQQEITVPWGGGILIITYTIEV